MCFVTMYKLLHCYIYRGVISDSVDSYNQLDLFSKILWYQRRDNGGHTTSVVIPSDISISSKAARINEEVPMPTKPFLADMFTDVSCFPSRCIVALVFYTYIYNG